MNSKKNTTIHQEWIEDPEYARAYFQAGFIQDVEEQLLEWMETNHIGQAELARRLGKTRAYVNQLFSGSRNMTLRTVADICWAIGIKPEFRGHTEAHPVGHKGSAVQI